MSAYKEWVEREYAQLRLDGKTHDEAMAAIRGASSAAVPQVVAAFIKSLGLPDDSGPIETPTNPGASDA